MRDSLSYNGYVGSVHFNADDEVFYGKIVGVDDLVTFEGTTVADLATSFRECGWPRRGRTYAAGRVTHLHPAKGISKPVRRRRYYPGLDSLLAAIRGEAPPERSLDHELTVQETLLRAIGLA